VHAHEQAQHESHHN